MDRITKTPLKRRKDKIASITGHPNVIEAAAKLSALVESVKCSICLEIMIQPARIKCGHTFCTLCIENTIQFNKADEGTLLRKLSGGSAKANCPLCKTRNITKRSIIADPILEEKVAIVKLLRNNIRSAAKEIGFDLDSVRFNLTERGTREGNSQTPHKPLPIVKKRQRQPSPQPASISVDNAVQNSGKIGTTTDENLGGQAAENSGRKGLLNDLGWASPSPNSNAVFKTYVSSKKKPNKSPKRKISRHFNKSNNTSSDNTRRHRTLDVPSNDSLLLEGSSPPKTILKPNCPIINIKENIAPNSTSSSLSLHSISSPRKQALEQKIDVNLSCKEKTNKAGRLINNSIRGLDIDSPSSSLTLHSIAATQSPKRQEMTLTSEGEEMSGNVKKVRIGPS